MRAVALINRPKERTRALAEKMDLSSANGFNVPQFSNMTPTQLEGDSDEEDEEFREGGQSGKIQSKITKKKAGGSGRRRIDIKFIENKSRRQVTFSRRKRGLMKKAYELTTLTGTQALVLIASETGHVYTFATPKLQPVVTLREGKELIQSCLNAPDNNYPPSDFLPNTTGGGSSGGSQGGQTNSGANGSGNGGKAARESPPSSPVMQSAQPPSHSPLQGLPGRGHGQSSPHPVAEPYGMYSHPMHPQSHYHPIPASYPHPTHADLYTMGMNPHGGK